MAQLTPMRREWLHQHTPAAEVMHADVPLRPVLLLVQAAHDALRHLLRASRQALRQANVVADGVEHTLQSVRAMEAVAGHLRLIFLTNSFRERVSSRSVLIWGWAVEKRKPLQGRSDTYTQL